MTPPLPQAEQRTLETPFGRAIGASYRWPGGQYCAIHTGRGMLGIEPGMTGLEALAKLLQ